MSKLSFEQLWNTVTLKGVTEGITAAQAARGEFGDNARAQALAFDLKRMSKREVSLGEISELCIRLGGCIEGTIRHVRIFERYAARK